MPSSAPPPWLVSALRRAGCVDPAGEARVLVSTSDDPAMLAELAARRAEGVPLEVLVGYADFAGLRLRVRPGVFVPRPRSELLAAVATELAAAAGRAPVVVDVGCGTGALAAVLATCLPGARVVATDLDPAAVACARENAATYGFEVRAGDLCDGLPAEIRGRVDVLVANVPHIPTAELVHLPRDTRAHEPEPAHDGGPDGLAVLRRLGSQAAEWLGPAGALAVELADRQTADGSALLAGHGLGVTARRDPEQRTTVLVGRLSRD